MSFSIFHRTAEPNHLAVLRKVSLFSDLSRHELQTLNDLLHQRTYIANEIIFDQGEEGQAIYFVLSGAVHVKRQHGPQILAELLSGDYFGERALLTDAPRTAQISASENTVLAVLFRNDFLSLLNTHPNIAKNISTHYSSQEVPAPTELLDESEQSELVLDASLPNLATHHLGGVTWIGVVALTCLLLFTFKKILWLVLPFLLALLLYYCLVPISKKMIRAGFSHSLAAIVLSSSFLLLIGIMLALFYPLAISNIDSWQHTLIHYLSGGANLVYTLLHTVQERFSFLQQAQFGEEIYLKVDDFAKNFSDKYLATIFATFARWLPSLLLAPLISFFLLKDGTTLRKMLGAAVPNAFFEKTLYLIHAVDHTAKLYFLGLIKIAVVDTTFMTLGLWLCGIPFYTAFVLGFIVAILNWIPYLGPLMGCALVLMVAATDFPSNMHLIYNILGLFIALRLLDDFISLPMILGKSLHIHPFVTIMMFVIGEAIAGVAGLILVIPILAIVMVFGETLEIIVTDKRLLARHQYTRKLSWKIASDGLDK